MQQYTVQDPQGNNRVIEGPDGASDEEIISQAQKLFGMSGAMPSSDPISAFKAALANHPARPNPQASAFDQDVATGNAVVPPEAKAIGALNTVAGGFGLGQLGAGLTNWGIGKAGSLIDTLKTAKGAENMVPLETPMEAGNIISTSKDAVIKANKNTAQTLYGKIPADVKSPLSIAPETADSIINEVKNLPTSFQSKKILSLAGDIQNMDKAPISIIQTMDSTLKDIASNGEGIEKVYAARLSKALQQDLENFGNTSIVQKAISQGPSLEAKDLRSLWADVADRTRQPIGIEDISRKGSYINPSNVQAPEGSLFSNSDIPTNIKTANSYYRDMSQLHNSPLAKALDRASLESKANIVFKAGKIDDVNTAKALLGNEGYAAAQSQFYQKLLSSKDIGKTIGKYQPDFLTAALTPSQMKALQAVDLIRRYASNLKTGAKAAGIGAGTIAAYEKLK